MLILMSYKARLQVENVKDISKRVVKATNFCNTDAIVAFMLVSVTYLMFRNVYTGLNERSVNNYEVAYK